MADLESRLDRVVDVLQQVNVNLEGVRISLLGLIQSREDHEARLRRVERWQHNLSPVLAVLTFILGAVFTETLGRVL